MEQSVIIELANPSQPVASSIQHMSLSSSQLTDDLKKYLPLYKAILGGDLRYVQEVCNEDAHVLEARITENSDTALHVAVETVTGNHIVEYLLTKMSNDQVALTNKDGKTVFSVAAIVGNVQAAKKIRKKWPDLLDIKNNDTPLTEAARHGHKEMITYLLQFMDRNLLYSYPVKDKTGVLFVHWLIIAGFYDLAIREVEDYPNLALMELDHGETLLSTTARKPSTLSSGTNQVYKGRMGEKKYTHQQKKRLAKALCRKITSDLGYERASSILKKSLLLAAESGVNEVVEEIIKSFPDAVYSDREQHNALPLAVINRHEVVYNLIIEMSSNKQLLLMSEDKSGNNILHLAGKLAPLYQLNRIPGAALKMQRELQWFKEVEKIVPPTIKEHKNSQGKTPAMVFFEEHQGLVKEGEKWMKDTATSCSIVTVLIATVVFAASITIPGGYNNRGLPIFNGIIPFFIFGVADAISLFSSVAAIFMFLSILTARYAEDDFLYALPKRLILGLFMLFVSITAMMVAFGASICLVFFEIVEVFCLLMGLTLFPVSMFAYSQFHLLRDLIFSTYGPGIFRKQSKGVFHYKGE